MAAVQPRLYPVADHVTVRVGPRSWESHPDGKGGYRPIDAARRGGIELPCPHCGGRLVRDGNREILADSAFGCPAPCGKKSVGAHLYAGLRKSSPRRSELS